jgi:hypothetical protein
MDRGVSISLTIQPRAPVVVDPTGPGAQPICFERGDSIAHPTSIPMFMDTVTGNPMIIPRKR